MVRTDVLRRIESGGVVNRVRGAQTAVLTALCRTPARPHDGTAHDRRSDDCLLAAAVPRGLRAGVWSEAAKPGAPVTLYRRNLQRAFLTILDEKLNATPAASAEIRMLVKGELHALDRQLQTAIAAPGLDETTRRHFADAREEIATALDPRVNRPAPDPNAAAAAGGRGRGGLR
jgi:hypothetical protein